MEWVLILIFLVLIVAGSYVVASYRVGSKAAARRFSIAFTCAAAGIGVSFILSRLIPARWQDYAWSGCVLLCALANWIALAVLLRRTRRVAQAGEILVEIGRPRGGLVIGIVGAGAFLLLGINPIVQAVTNSDADAESQMRLISRGVLYLSLAVFFLVSQLSTWSVRTIRERGVVMYGQLLTWRRITSFQWDEDRPATLVLRVKKRLPWWRTIYLQIPMEKREAVTEILERNTSSSIEDGSAD